MSAVLAIAAREIRERRFLVVTAFVVGLLPLGAGLLPSIPLEDAQDARELLGLLLGMAFPTAVALAVGSSIVGRDVADGRLGFYFSRPLSGFAIWAGKFLGGVVLLVVASLLIVGPSMLVSGFVSGVLVVGRHIPEPLRLAPAALLGLLAGAHVASSLYRARSRWIALDLVLAAATFLAFVWLVSQLIDAGADDAVELGMPLLLAGGAACLIAAGAIHLVVGRADPQRGRRALSTAVWALMGLLLLGVFGLTRWVLSTTPQEVGVGYPAYPAPRGVGLLFGGSTEGRAGYRPMFIMNGATGAYSRFAQARFTIPAFSPDGQRAVWVAPAAMLMEDKRAVLAVANFGEAIPSVKQLRIGGTLDASLALALASDGRALVSCRGSVALLDSLSGAVLAELATSEARAGAFLPDGQIRVVERSPGSPAGAVVRDWNPRSGASVERARVRGPWASVFGMAGDHVLLSTDGRELLWLDLAQDTRTSVWSLDPNRPNGTPLFGSPRLALAGGGFAIGMFNEVVILASDGSRRASVDLGKDSFSFGFAEPSPGELAIGVWSRQTSRHSSLVVDPATGRILRELPGLLPAGPRWEESKSSHEIGSFASRLFVDDENALLELLPDGKRRVVVAGGH